MESRGALFREIHKNTWLKRLTAEGRLKRSERSWVVFCVHDDTEALLEGYTEPRMAVSHNPDWVISLHNVQHISHALVPNEQEYEFVITLSNSVVRFHANSWDSMQEWVDTLRLKLREMKILSPKENLYTKLPEARTPLLPTRDPTSPLPATPPVPAAIVPGVECVIPPTNNNTTSQSTSTTPSESSSVVSTSTNAIVDLIPPSTVLPTINQSIVSQAAANTTTTITPANATAMSNTLTQNLLNMLTDPISNYSVQMNKVDNEDNYDSNDEFPISNSRTPDTNHLSTSLPQLNSSYRIDTPSLARIFTNNVLSEPNTCPTFPSNSSSLKKTASCSGTTENSIRVDVSSNQQNCDLNVPYEPSSPSGSVVETKVLTRPQTVRSLSLNEAPTHRLVSLSNNNIIELDVVNQSRKSFESSEEPSTNITIIQVSNPLPQNKTPEMFKFPPPESLRVKDEYKSNVKVIPSNTNAVPAKTNSQHCSPSKSASDVCPAESSQITKVHVAGTLSSNSYGKICTSTSNTPKGSKKIILSANTSGITNISVNSEMNSSPAYYEKVFLTSSIPISAQNNSSLTSSQPENSRCESAPSESTINIGTSSESKNTSIEINKSVSSDRAIASTSAMLPPPIILEENRKLPVQLRKKSHVSDVGRENIPPQPLNRPVLTRGVTEAVITARPSRIDMKKIRPRCTNSKNSSNNNSESHPDLDRTRSESLEQRRRSSSTSDAQNSRQRQGNGENRLRGQQSVQPFRLTQENAFMQASKKLTLREQQVKQLRREIMHPGGVRLQLRRKDCVGSVAWVDAFGAVWVAGWKQKDHPMLYNALHIGDQLISIAGVTVNNATEANKVIRNTNTLFLEVLIRRVPFGRVYAIRRELEGQCLGLIRDGNTATIVDVIPNSLAARYGLPPKAQSCDGLSLTFWVLTEINGRPLNLFFKENEVRDRLNSVGRDISILVQPSDLVTKLKKQLKSLRGYKDYIVQ